MRSVTGFVLHTFPVHFFFVFRGVPLLVPCVVLGALPYGVRPPYLLGAFFCSWVSLVSTLCVRGTFPYGRLPSPLTSLRVKPRPNNSNMSTQHCWAQYLKYCAQQCCAFGRPVAPNMSQHVAPKHFALTCCDRLAGALEVRSLCVLHAFRMSFICAFPRVPCMVSVPIRRVFPISETDIYSYNKIFIVYKFISYIKA